MSLIFSYRSNTETAYYAPAGEQRGYLKQGGTLTDIAAYSATGWFGSTSLDLNNNGLNGEVWFSDGVNTPATAGFTLNYRFSWSVATQTAQDSLFQLGPLNSGGRFGVYWNGATGLQCKHTNEFAQNGLNNATLASSANWYANLNAPDQANDLTISYLNTSTGGIVRAYLNGTGIGSATSSRAYNSLYGARPYSGIHFGAASNSKLSAHHLNEALIFDPPLSEASITSAFTGTARVAWYSSTANTPTTSTDPGIANVLSGTGYDFKGASLTGTYAVPTYSDPGVANVLSGTSYVFNDSTLAGTYHDGSYTDPGVSKVLSGTNYIFNDSTLTGTLSGLVALTGAASTAPIVQAKTLIRSALAENNTSTGAPVIDLSSDLDDRVGGVFCLNPEQIPLLGNVFPAVSVFIDRKEIEAKGIVKNQANGKRKAELSIQVAGMVFVPNFMDDKTIDPADNQVEYLMENVERILRGYDNLGSNVSWQFPNSVEYHSATWDEESHMRVGLMNLTAHIFY